MLKMKAGQVKLWLNQGPATLLAQCNIADPLSLDEHEENPDAPHGYEQGWVISLLQTGEILTVHENTLHNGQEGAE